MPLFFAEGSPATVLSDARLREIVHENLRLLEQRRGAKYARAALVPPDFTRFHSKSGAISQFAYEYLQENVKDVLPALGTHAAMTDDEIAKKRRGDYRPRAGRARARGERWQSERTVASADQLAGEPFDFAQYAKLYAHAILTRTLCMQLWTGEHDLILSIGQVVPHEVMGMANYNKNIFVGTGGSEAINFSHFIGAVYGMERMMGRADNPLRRILNYASTHFVNHLPIVYIQTVIGRGSNGELVTRGVFIGDDEECFMKAAELSLEVNFQLLDAPLDKVVVYLDPHEFKSTWLGNKSIYRTRMAIADGGELIVLAPGVHRFGEDQRIDELIRKYGYRTTPVRVLIVVAKIRFHEACGVLLTALLLLSSLSQEVLAHLSANRDLMKNLSAVAHLIHGSSEGRFKITYCPAHLTKEEVEGVGFAYGDLDEMSKKYPIDQLEDGWNTTSDNERFFYISNPALGLWAYRGRFESSSAPSPAAAASGEQTSLVAQSDASQPSADAGVGGGPFQHTHGL